MSIQEDVLDCIGPGGVDAKDLRGRMGNIPQNELDVCTGALMRAGKITLSFGRFELPGSRRMPSRLAGSAATAPGHAAATRQPDTKACASCSVPKPLCEFRVISADNRRADECNTCHGKKTRQGQIKAAAIKVTAPVVERTEPTKTAAEPAPPEPPKLVVIADQFIDRIRARQMEAVEANVTAADELVRLEEKAGEIRAAMAKRAAYIVRCDEFFASAEVLAGVAL